RHGAVQRLQLLVEEGAQALELVGVAKLLGADDLVIGAGEYFVAEGLGVLENREVGAPRLRTAHSLWHVRLAVEAIGSALIALVERLVGHGVLIGFGIRGQFGALAALGVLVLGVGGGRLRLAILTLAALVASLVELVGEVQGGEKIAREPAKGILVED